MHTGKSKRPKQQEEGSGPAEGEPGCPSAEQPHPSKAAHKQTERKSSRKQAMHLCSRNRCLPGEENAVGPCCRPAPLANSPPPSCSSRSRSCRRLHAARPRSGVPGRTDGEHKEATVSNLVSSQRRAADVAFRAAALSREGGGTSISLDKSAGPPGMSRLTNRFPLLSGLNAIPSPHNLGHC